MRTTFKVWSSQVARCRGIDSHGRPLREGHEEILVLIEELLVDLAPHVVPWRDPDDCRAPSSPQHPGNRFGGPRRCAQGQRHRPAGGPPPIGIPLRSRRFRRRSGGPPRCRCDCHTRPATPVARSAGCSRQDPRADDRGSRGVLRRLVHGYFDLDLKVIWATVERDVPRLRAQIAAILESMSGVDAD